MIQKVKAAYKANISIRYLTWVFIGLGALWIFVDGITAVSNFLGAPKVEVVKIMIQIFGGSLVLYGLSINLRRTEALEKQVNVAEDGNITERFQKAIEQLGNQDNAIVRLGGIHSLGRIANESIEKGTEDWRLVVDVFTSYLSKCTSSVHEERKLKEIDFSAVHDYLFASDFKKCLNDREFYVEIKRAAYCFWTPSVQTDFTRFSSCHFLTLNKSYIIEKSEFEMCRFGQKGHRNEFGSVAFCDTKISSSDFNGLELHGTNFKAVEFSHVKFIDSTIWRFEKCQFIWTTFENCDFSDSVFKECIFHIIYFKNPKGFKAELFKDCTRVGIVRGLSAKQQEELSSVRPDASYPYD